MFCISLRWLVAGLVPLIGYGGRTVAIHFRQTASALRQSVLVCVDKG